MLLLFKVFGIILIASCVLNGESYPGVLVSIPISYQKVGQIYPWWERSQLPVKSQGIELMYDKAEIMSQVWNSLSWSFSKFSIKNVVNPCWSRARLNHRNGAEGLEKLLVLWKLGERATGAFSNNALCESGESKLGHESFIFQCWMILRPLMCLALAQCLSLRKTCLWLLSNGWKMGRAFQRLFPLPS